jgi:hypothetical protein
MELDLVLNWAWRFLNLKKCVKIGINFFLNGKNQAKTCMQIIFNFFKRIKIGTNGFWRKRKIVQHWSCPSFHDGCHDPNLGLVIKAIT